MCAPASSDSGSAASAQDASAVRRWLIAVLALLLLMVAVGGITRLTESGLSIVEWKPVMGTLPPLSEAAWQAAFEQYKQYPQYAVANPDMTLSEFKVIFLWEYVHRLLGRIIGLVYAFPYFWFLLRGRLSRKLAVQLGIGLVLGGLQGVLGWWMVKSGLVDVPRVSHYRLAAHLSLAFLIFGYLLWVLLSLNPWRPALQGTRAVGWVRGLSLAFAVLLLVQVVYGAFTAGLRAGYAFNTWPKMLGHWLPPGWQGFEPAWRNLVENPITVQFIHRNLAWLLVLVALGLGWAGLASDRPGRLRFWLLAVPSIAGLQFLLGVLTLIWTVPVPIATAHQVVACLLVGATTGLFHDLQVVARISKAA